MRKSKSMGSIPPDFKSLKHIALDKPRQEKQKQQHSNL
jgi:hypothetical protein